MAPPSGARRPIWILGAPFPAAIVWLCGFIVTASVVLAVAGRGASLPLLGQVALVPALLLRGEVWRALSWCFFELDPLGLIFSIMVLAFLGRDLVSAWGPRRFLAFYAGLGVVAAAATLLVSLVWRDLGAMRYLSTWPVVEGLIVAWATLFPTRQLLLYFVLPVQGRTLVILTLGGTVLFALLAAIAAALVYVRSFNNLLVRWKMSRLVRTARRPSHLKVVEKKKDNGGSGWVH
jgi:membrane associated rhomboid family serine protease